MDGFAPAPAMGPVAETEAALRLATEQLADAERTLREIAGADPIPPAGVTYRDRCMVWRSSARACLTRMEGG